MSANEFPKRLTTSRGNKGGEQLPVRLIGNSCRQNSPADGRHQAGVPG
jgi:hypothetical protein